VYKYINVNKYSYTLYLQIRSTRADLLWGENGESMEFLTWTAIAVGGSLCILFLYWLPRPEGIEARRIRCAFFVGTSILMLFLLIFTMDYLRLLPQRTNADMITNEVVSGKRTWHKYICIDCHTLLGNGAYYAPDLTKSWDRFLARSGGDEELASRVMEAFLMTPPQPTHKHRGMPRFKLTEEDSRGLVKFLRWVANIDTNDWPPKPLAPDITMSLEREVTIAFPSESLVKEGESLFLSKGCSACHTLGQGTKVGPDLIDAIRRHNTEYLIRWIKSPQAIYKELNMSPINKGFPLMPELGLSQAEASAITTYLKWKGGHSDDDK
jgi:nitric oxide reductase subunit C